MLCADVQVVRDARVHVGLRGEPVGCEVPNLRGCRGEFFQVRFLFFIDLGDTFYVMFHGVFLFGLFEGLFFFLR